MLLSPAAQIAMAYTLRKQRLLELAVMCYPLHSKVRAISSVEVYARLEGQRRFCKTP